MYTRMILVLTIAIGFSSCAAYRSGTTPDDVYYSPEREREYFYDFREEEARTSSEDYRLRQQIRDARLRTLDDDFFWTNRNNWQFGNSWMNGPVWGNGWHGIGGFPMTPFNTWNQPFFCIPGTNFVVSSPVNRNGIKTSPRYTPSITVLSNNQPRNTGTTSGKLGTRSTGNGSRFFGGATNQSGNSFRFNFPSGGGSGNYMNGSSGGSGSRTFGSGSSPSGRSSSGSSGSSGTRTRRN